MQITAKHMPWKAKKCASDLAGKGYYELNPHHMLDIPVGTKVF